MLHKIWIVGFILLNLKVFYVRNTDVYGPPIITKRSQFLFRTGRSSKWLLTVQSDRKYTIASSLSLHTVAYTKNCLCNTFPLTTNYIRCLIKVKSGAIDRNGHRRSSKMCMKINCCPYINTTISAIKHLEMFRNCGRKSKDKHSMGEMCNCALKLIKEMGPRKR